MMDSKTADAPVAKKAGTNQLIFAQIAVKIIAQQETIIGPIAVEQAKQVKQLSVDWSKHEVEIDGNPQAAIDKLVEQYKELFGQIAVETCREAVASQTSQLSPDELPQSLK
jgi:hypothetical protein